MFYNECFGLLLGGCATALTTIGLENWISFITVLMSNTEFFKDFNGYDKKVSRYNTTIQMLQDHLMSWESKNSTEKNTRDNIDNFILYSEMIINNENKKWIMSKQAANARNKKEIDKMEKNKVVNINEKKSKANTKTTKKGDDQVTSSNSSDGN